MKKYSTCEKLKKYYIVITCNAYDRERPAIEPLTVPRCKTANKAAKNTIAFPIMSSLIANHLKYAEVIDKCLYIIKFGKVTLHDLLIQI